MDAFVGRIYAQEGASLRIEIELVGLFRYCLGELFSLKIIRFGLLEVELYTPYIF